MYKKHNSIDYIGKKFNSLILLKMVSAIPTSKNNPPKYLCKCDCGVEKIISWNCIQKGTTRSCGCSRKFAHSKEKGLGNFNKLYNSYKNNSKRRNLNFELDVEEFRELTKKNCFYCNIEPSTRYNSKNMNGEYIYNGIDRINNDIGYTLENCVPCCGICNLMKRNLSLEEFKDKLRAITKNLNIN